MINARIYPNDLVFVRKQDDVESGDIAVVIIDNETATLKRVLKKRWSADPASRKSRICAHGFYAC